MKKSLIYICIAITMTLTSNSAYAVPDVTGEPLIVDYIGSIDWPQETDVTVPFLTQGDANKNIDLHGEVSCDVIISTPGNYHMALTEVMRGFPGLIDPTTGLEFVGLAVQIKKRLGLTTCWTTSPPVNEEQIPAERLQFGNVDLVGRPILAMGPGGKMTNLINKKLVVASTKSAFIRNRGNAMLVRADKADLINSVCDLGKQGIRLVTPRPKDVSGAGEPGSFGNFSGTIYNTAVTVGCRADLLFNTYFGQALSGLHLSGLRNPFNHAAFIETYRQPNLRWVASSRIMHRDQPYALCNGMADVGVIFYHQAVYLHNEMYKLGCKLVLKPFAAGGTVPEINLSGNKIGTLFVAHVTDPNHSFTADQIAARDYIYKFLLGNPLWEKILNKHHMDFPTP